MVVEAHEAHEAEAAVPHGPPPRKGLRRLTGPGWLRVLWFVPLSWVLATLLVVQLGWALSAATGLTAPVGSKTSGASVSSVRELGRVLFTDHGFAFEATSILILVAMVGAVVLARREGDS